MFLNILSPGGDRVWSSNGGHTNISEVLLDVHDHPYSKQNKTKQNKNDSPYVLEVECIIIVVFTSGLTTAKNKNVDSLHALAIKFIV